MPHGSLVAMHKFPSRSGYYNVINESSSPLFSSEHKKFCYRRQCHHAMLHVCLKLAKTVQYLEGSLLLLLRFQIYQCVELNSVLF